MMTASRPGVLVAHRGRHPEVTRMPLQYATRTCGSCQRQFDIPLKNVRRGEGKYCSRKCSGVARTYSVDRDFWPFVDRSAGSDACWPWTGRCDADGYGIWTSANRTYKAHRVAYASDRGCPVDSVPLVRHLCEGGGNSWCCNPSHLADGTVQDNADDRVKAGRQIRGEQIGSARLTAEQVREIRRRSADGETTRGLARSFGVNGRTVGNIVRGRTWGHVA